MGRGEVQREMRITTAVIAQGTAERAAPGTDSRLQVGAFVSAQPRRGRPGPIPPLGVAPGQLTQETLSARLALVTAATLVPREEGAVRRRRRGEIRPAARVTGDLRHGMTLLAASRPRLRGGQSATSRVR